MATTAQTRRQYGSRQFGPDGWMVEANWYENRTNLPGSRFLATNIHLGPFRCYARLEWFRWPDAGGRERGLEVQWTLPLIGDYRVRVGWQHSSFTPDRSHG